MRTRTTYHQTLTLKDGTELDVELPLPMSSIMDYTALLQHETADTVTIGYLVDDSDAEDPCENDDYMGHIYEARRHGSTLGEYERACAVGDFEGEEPAPYAVMLDVFEHGQVKYSVSGSGPQCEWDNARGAAVFVPNDLLLEDIKASADPKARAWELAKQAAEAYTDWRNGETYGTVIVTYDLEGSLTDHDACWGYIGGDDAYGCLKDEFPKD